ncbi:MAG: PAS domain S-box protein [Thermoguttaceae bacterium]
MRDSEKTRDQLLEELAQLRQRVAALEAADQSQLLEVVPLGIHVCDTEGRIILVNAAQEAVTGYAADELLGTHVWDRMERVSEKGAEAARLRSLAADQPVPSPYFSRNVRKNGEVYDVRIDWNYRRNSRGQIVGFVSIISDVTEQKRLERELQQSEQHYRALTDSTTDIIFILNRSGDVLYANPSAASGIRCDADNLVGLRQEQLFPPDKVKRHLENIAGVFETGTVYDEDGMYHFGPDEIWLNTRLMPLRDQSGTITAVMGVARNITARKRAEAALKQARDVLETRVEERTAQLAEANRALQRSHAELQTTYDQLAESEAKYRLLVETTGTGYLILDEEGKVVDANREYVRLTGHRTLAEIMGRSVVEWTAPHDAERNAREVAKCLKTGTVRQLEIDYVVPGGGFIPIEINARVIKDKQGSRIISLCRDITDRKKAEEALRHSEQKYKGLVEASPDAIIIADVKGNVLFASHRTWEFLGCSEQEDLVGRSVFEFVVESDRPRLAANIPNLMKTRIRKNTEYTARRKDGTTFPVDISSAAGPNTEQQPWAILAVVRDISERKQYEETLRQSEEKYRGLVDICPDSIVTSDLSGKTRFVSKQTWKLLGIPEQEELVGQDTYEYVIEADRPRLMANYANLLKTGKRGETEYTVLRRDGATVPVELSSVISRDAQGRPTGAMAIIRDVSERKRAEQALQKEHRTLKHLLRSSDHERQLIAYEIHDELAQQLAGALMQIETYWHQKQAKPQEAAKAYDAAVTMLRQAHFETRRLISGVRPPILDESGIVAAVAHLVNEQRLQYDLKIEFCGDVSFNRLVPILENAAYRIVQEALTNSCRHSKSDRVRVEVVQFNNALRIKVQDWGVGFNPAAVRDDHFGLEGIRERARLLGGATIIESAPDRGTSIIVELPLVPRDE